MKKFRGFVYFSLVVMFGLLGLPTRTTQAEAPAQKSFLWKVKSKTGTVYFLGSIHYATEEIYPLPETMIKAFDESQALYVEANVKAVDPIALQTIMMQKGTYPPETNLAKEIPAALLEQTRTELAKLEMPLEMMLQFKPWFIAFQITALKLVRMGLNPELGIDMFFLKRAASENKEVRELEGIDAQINLLSNLPKSEQEIFLTYTLKTMGKVEQGLPQLIAAWKQGDTVAIAEDLFAEDFQDKNLVPFYEKFFYKRNREMAEKTAELLKTQQTSFVVVGAGHLLGPQGVIVLLEQKGFSAEQL